jgi:phospholipid transport system substrate-binding protein
VSYLLAGAPVSAGAPADEVKATLDNVLGVLQDASFKGADKQKDRRAKLKNIIYPKFDFAEMAKRSLGTNWARRSAEEQKTFVALFTELIESSYVDAIESYEGEKIAIANERQDKSFAEVSTRIISKKGDPFAIDYKLHQSDGSWKVYDVVVENISLVNNYRSQFNRVIAKNSYEELVNRMKEKQFDAPKKKAKT